MANIPLARGGRVLALRRHFNWPVAAMLAGASVVGALVAAGIVELPVKVLVAFLGAIMIGSIAVMSGHLRTFLIGLLVLLVSLDVKSFPQVLGYRQSHFFGLGGAAGVVVTAQFVLVVPLFVLAWLHWYGEDRASRGRLPAGSYLLPLLPLLAAVPSFLVSQDIQLSAYELLRMLCFYLLYLYFAIELKRSEVPLVIGALLIGVMLLLPFVAAELVLPSFRYTVVTGGDNAIVEGIGGTTVKRVSATLTHPNVLGGYLGLLWPIALLFAIVPAVPRLRWPAIAVVVVSIPILALTMCRGCWVGFAAALPVVVLLAAIRGHLSPHQATAILTVAAVGCVFVLLLPPVWSRLVASDPGNVTFRVDINESAIAMWRANPLLGVGLNLFPENVGDYDVRHVSLYRWPVHNIYLLWLAETGIVGAAGMGVYMIWGFYRAWRASGDEDAVISLLAIGFLAGAVGLYVGELVSFSTRLESIAQAFAILLGTVIATSRHGADAPPMPGPMIVTPPVPRLAPVPSADPGPAPGP